MQAYTTIKAEASDEFIEKRSRFIGSIRPVCSEEEAAAFIAELKSAHRDAAHNCSAYFLRDGAQRYSDDGEPQGTAGMPILEVLRRENIVDVALVVTRYFGGILLGAGGLVRAYSHTAKLALDAAERLVMQPCRIFSLSVPYPVYDRVSLLIAQHQAVVMESAFGAGVDITLRIPATAAESFAADIVEYSGGQVQPVATGEIFA